MNQHPMAQMPATRLLEVLLHVLAPDDGASDEQQLLQHFPFARVGEQAAPNPRIRIPTTVHGSL